ncbi:hypothetical protein Mal52_08340 [Symmachiella dynata]|uniref:Uncharacterized protein n=1 Tax=Symmachiella dynata TaxID=2527995 RepID=A0A517ZIR7_9PLAN|nr:hypothetical protein Mal52_08340 [Symmachiella dynata]
MLTRDECHDSPVDDLPLHETFKRLFPMTIAPNNDSRSALYFSPWEIGICTWVGATLWLVSFPAVYPTPIGDGIVPNWLFFSPSRLGWAYLLFCPVAAIPAGLVTMGLHSMIDRRVHGRTRIVVRFIMLTCGMAFSVIWSLMIYRSDPDGKYPSARDRQVPVRHSTPAQ